MMDPKELKEHAVQAGQPGSQTETASLSQSDIEQQHMTTEEFHRLLEENVTRHADERTRHQEELTRIARDYQNDMDSIAIRERKDELRYRAARKAFDDAKDEYNANLRVCGRLRNEAGQRKNKAQAEEANRWTLNNNIIQSDRHNIFERYRISGGGLAGDLSELLHPSWSRRDKQKGGVSDEEAE